MYNQFAREGSPERKTRWQAPGLVAQALLRFLSELLGDVQQYVFNDRPQDLQGGRVTPDWWTNLKVALEDLDLPRNAFLPEGLFDPSQVFGRDHRIDGDGHAGNLAPPGRPVNSNAPSSDEFLFIKLQISLVHESHLDQS